MTRGQRVFAWLTVALWLVALGLTVAHAGGVGQVGTVGTLMAPSGIGGGGGGGPNPFGIVTEADVQIITESDQDLVTEAAP